MDLKMSNAGLFPIKKMCVVNQDGNSVETRIVCERPLTIKMDGQKVITLMTIGTNLCNLHNGRDWESYKTPSGGIGRFNYCR